MVNYVRALVLWIVPALAALGMQLRREWLGLMSSGLVIAGIVLSVGVFMFPLILPSSVNP